jgi:LDH2 family malate/lactate/ureidoglycolate dehydrogenase
LTWSEETSYHEPKKARLTVAVKIIHCNIEEILHQDGDVRLPGDRRLELREKAHLNGISLTDKQYQEIVSLSRRKKVNQ